MEKRLTTVLIFLLAALPVTAPAKSPASTTANRFRPAQEAATTDASSLELFQEGESYRRAGNYAKAEACFLQAWARESRKPTLEPPTWRRLVVFVGLAYQNNHELDKAVALFKEAIAKDPQYPLFHYFLATTHAFIEMDKAESEGMAPPAEEGEPGPQPPQTPAVIIEELRRAYQLKANLNPGEKIPNPRTDVFLGPLRHDPRFKAVLSEAGAAAAPDLEADMAEMLRDGEDAGPDIQQAIVEEIEANPTQAADLLMRKIVEPDLTEKQRAGYIWALGRTADPRAATALTGLLYRPETAPLKGVILEALSRIGGRQAGDALVLELRDAREDNDRFQLLTLLANMQYEPALHLMLELLKMDTEQAANQMLFCFGKMGEKATPLLLTKAYDPNTTVRINAINMLRWIGSSRTMIPLQKEFTEEKDLEVRQAILEAMSGVMRPDQLETFLNATLAKERDREFRGVLREKLGQVKEMKDAFEQFKAGKIDDRNVWTTTLDTLSRSYGRAGSIEALARTSTPRDEAELVRLRERVLDRQSPECFRDYMRLSQIIAYNRMLGK